jgi:arginyl-tRNA synthetase
MLVEKIAKLIKKTIKKLQIKEKLPLFKTPQIKVELKKEKIHGDFATNIALVLGKIVKKEPLRIANIIAKTISQKLPSYLEKIEVKEPGFINFFLSQKFLFENLKKIISEKERYGRSKIGKGKAVIVDYSSPNIAKRFGIGHLRSTIIGQAIYNLYEALGFKVIGDNHIGDWGTQFGEIIFQIKRKNLDPKKLTVEEMEKLYVEFHKETEKKPQIIEEGRQWFKKLEKGNKEARRVWKICVKKSLKEFEKIYKILNVKIDYTLGESFYEPMLKGVIEELKRKKIAKESQGALIVKFKDLPPAILVKSDGATTYFTRDLATIKYRLKRWKPNLVIYEVGTEQKLHFQQLFRTVELLNWAKKTKFIHVAHGLYRLKGGKFSTRRGKTVHLEEVLEEAIERAKRIIEKSKTPKNLSKKEKEEIAKIVGIGAIKYNDLKQHPSKDIIFDWEKILNLKGNSAPYLQYTFVRAKSVLLKAKRFKFCFKNSKLRETELEILRDLVKFPDILKEAAFRFSPNLLCDFLFELAKKFNLFYDTLPILKAKSEKIKNFRLTLTLAVSYVIKNSLSILGISVPKRM